LFFSPPRYIKLGQQIATQSQVLPTPYRTAFSSFVDDAPAVPWKKILPLLVREFGASPDDVFESFEHAPFASASIAQVYRATTKDGRKVAVKVQKPAIPIQLEWDLCEFDLWFLLRLPPRVLAHNSFLIFPFTNRVLPDDDVLDAEGFRPADLFRRVLRLGADEERDQLLERRHATPSLVLFRISSWD